MDLSKVVVHMVRPDRETRLRELIRAHQPSGTLLNIDVTA